MEPTALAQAAATVAGIGALSLVTALLNVVALRAVRVDDLPGCVQGRIRWWGAHNSAFLVISAVLTAAGLAGLAAT
jgi:hypothetical protein